MRIILSNKEIYDISQNQPFLLYLVERVRFSLPIADLKNWIEDTHEDDKWNYFTQLFPFDSEIWTENNIKKILKNTLLCYSELKSRKYFFIHLYQKMSRSVGYMAICYSGVLILYQIFFYSNEIIHLLSFNSLQHKSLSFSILNYYFCSIPYVCMENVTNISLFFQWKSLILKDLMYQNHSFKIFHCYRSLISEQKFK